MSMAPEFALKILPHLFPGMILKQKRWKVFPFPQTISASTPGLDTIIAVICDCMIKPENAVLTNILKQPMKIDIKGFDFREDKVGLTCRFGIGECPNCGTLWWTCNNYFDLIRMSEAPQFQEK